MSKKLKVAVLGATGYSGLELARLLGRHPMVDTPLLLRRMEGAPSESRSPASEMAGQAGNGHGTYKPFSWGVLQEQNVEILFLATPHSVSRDVAPEAVARGLRIIDLSGAWRLKQAKHRAVYGFSGNEAPATAELDDRSVYGLPELNAAQISSANLVANPGCYATSIILALAPLFSAELVDRDRGIISDSKSGVSGAGKELSERTHFVNVADNFSAYSVFGHRHTGEILEQLRLGSENFIFTPHLLPIPRGILSTIYLQLNRKATAVEIENCYTQFFEGKKFIRIYPASTLPEIRFSTHTNFCDLGFSLAPDGRRLILVSCLDNLLKGAAGQAIQNMNVMNSWPESEGLQ